jgi:hypothetical protein
MATIGTIEFCRRIHKPNEEIVVIDYERAVIGDYRYIDEDRALQRQNQLPTAAAVTERGIQVYPTAGTIHTSETAIVSIQYIVDSKGYGHVKHDYFLPNTERRVDGDDTYQIFTINQQEIYERKATIKGMPDGSFAYITVATTVDSTAS